MNASLGILQGNLAMLFNILAVILSDRHEVAKSGCFPAPEFRSEQYAELICY